jgi:hypothetical protein
MLTPAGKRRIASKLREEHGAIWVMLALFMPVALVLAAFVVDVGNWFVHQRHLQTQVDAAALAAGGKWVFTVSSSGGTTCSDSAIEGEAVKYAGDPTRLPSTYNTQVADPPKVHVVFNSPTYWSNGSSTPDDALGAPCATGFIDVKATDDRPSLFFSSLFPGFSHDITAHARVSFVKLDTISKSVPVALVDPTPKTATAYFVNESTGAYLRDSLNQPISTPLFYNTTASGIDYWSSTNTTQTPPVQNNVMIPSSQVTSGQLGVRIALSGSTTNNQCGQALVTCYDTSGNTSLNGPSPLFGIDNVRVYDPAATPGTAAGAHVAVYGAKLTSADCGDGNQTNAYFPTAACAVRLHVRVAFAPGITPANVIMTARVDGSQQNGNQYTMAAGISADCPTADPAGSLCWESTQDIPISAVPGWHTIDIAWSDANTGDSLGGQQCKSSGGLPCSDTGTPGATAQRVFFADSVGAGPLQSVDILDSNGVRAEQAGSTAFHSYAVGTSIGPIGVQMGITAAFSNAPVTSPPVTMRLVAGQGSHTVDCNPSTGPYATQYNNQIPNYNPGYTSRSGQLQYGCIPKYTKWDGTTACPGASPGTLYPGTKNDLWSNTTQPWACIATQTGLTPADVGQGLNARVLTDPTTCPPAGQPGHNNWDPGGSPTWTPGQLAGGDPRRVAVLLAPFGSFGGSGTETYPVTRFATFYITGWQGNPGNSNPCQVAGNGDDPAAAGEIKGHFMTYAQEINNGGGDITDPCTDPSSIDVCVAVLTQ